MKPTPWPLLLAALLSGISGLRAQVPQMISYQGRVSTNGVAFTGTGQFKFALVDGAGSVSFWSNDGTSTGGSQPAAVVSLPVTNGLFSVMLGDTSLPGMTVPISLSTFANPDVRLRLWFNDGRHGFEVLSPDVRIGASGYAMQAGSAAGFAGSLAGDVTGPQGATVVSSVGGQSAAGVAGGASAANAATSEETPNAIVKRDATGSFAASSITATGTITGNGVGLTNVSGTATAIAPGITATNLTLVSGTNQLTPMYGPGQGPDLLIHGSTNLLANGWYSLASATVVDQENGCRVMVWTNGNGQAAVRSENYDGDGDCLWNWTFTNRTGGANFRYIDGFTYPFTEPAWPGESCLWNTNGTALDGYIGYSTNTIAKSYALFANVYGNVAGNVYGNVYGNVSGNLSGNVTGNVSGNISGTISGDGFGLTNLNVAATVLANDEQVAATAVAKDIVSATLHRNALLRPIMGVQGGRGYSGEFVTNTAVLLKQSGLTALGFNMICLDIGWGERTNGSLQARTWLTSEGITNLIYGLSTYGCYLGVHMDPTGYYYPEWTTVATAYDDGFLLSQWGIRQVWFDPGYMMSLQECALFVRGVQDGALQSGNALMDVYGAGFSLMNSWTFDLANEAYVGTDDHGGSTSPAARQKDLANVLSYPQSVGPGFLVYIGPIAMPHNYSVAWWNTNYARADMGVMCLAPSSLDFPADSFHSGTCLAWEEIGILTNHEAIRINQDPLMSPGLCLSPHLGYGTNSTTQKVLYRLLSNGDVALGCWNLSTNETSKFDVPISQVPYLYGNVVNVQDVFGQTSGTVTGTLSTVVNPGGFNLYRLQKP